MLPTPDLSHLKRADYEHVYEPQEDTFLMLDALERDAVFLQQRGIQTVLEMGSGTGVITAMVASILKETPTPVLYLTTDVNPKACDATRRTGRHLKIMLHPVQTTFAHGMLSPRLGGNVDLLLFNFPYVPTTDAEWRDPTDALVASWAGGVDGRRVIDQWLEEDWLNRLASHRAVCYLVVVEENRPDELISRLEASGNWQGERLLERKAGRERLVILRFTRRTTKTPLETEENTSEGRS